MFDVHLTTANDDGLYATVDTYANALRAILAELGPNDVMENRSADVFVFNLGDVARECVWSVIPTTRH